MNKNKDKQSSYAVRLEFQPQILPGKKIYTENICALKMPLDLQTAFAVGNSFNKEDYSSLGNLISLQSESLPLLGQCITK